MPFAVSASRAVNPPFDRKAAGTDRGLYRNEQVTLS